MKATKYYSRGKREVVSFTTWTNGKRTVGTIRKVGKYGKERIHAYVATPSSFSRILEALGMKYDHLLVIVYSDHTSIEYNSRRTDSTIIVTGR